MPPSLRAGFDAGRLLALTETINGLLKAEVIHRRGSWRSFEAVESATLERVNRHDQRRLLEPIGNMPPPKQRRVTMPRPGHTLAA